MQISTNSFVKNAVVAFSTMLPLTAGCDQKNKNTQVPLVNHREDEFNSIGKKVHEPKYISPKDSSSKIQIPVGSAIVVQTDHYAVVPAYLGGKLKVQLEGARVLRHFLSENGGSFFGGSTKDGKVSGFFPSVLFLAEEPGLTKLTVTFYDKDGKEQEKTTYSIEVK